MSAGTKIFLAVVALFIGTVVIYYAVIAPQNETKVERDPAIDENAPAGEFRNELPTDQHGSYNSAGVSAVNIAANNSAFNTPATGERTTPAWQAPVPRIVPGSNYIDDGGKDSPDSIAMGPPLPFDYRPTTVQANVPISAADTRLANSTTPNTASNRPALNPLLNAAEMSQNPAAATNAAAHSTYTTYTVRPGDTLVYIAEDWFGDEHKWDLILAANPDLKNPNRLQVGQSLKLPPKTVVRVAHTNESSPNVAQGGYTVAAGDTLTVIAQKQYGQSSAWKLIYDANRQAIGDNPNRLKVGMKLTIPPKPTARQ